MSVLTDIQPDQLLLEIADLGVVSQRTLRSLRRKMGKRQSQQDSDKIIDTLVRKKELTNFQADELREGRGSQLVYGDYVVFEELGSGGMGFVFKACHRDTGKTVALKVLHPSSVDSKVALDRFKREVKATQRLSHPSIITALDAGEANGIHYLVMPFVDGTNLQSLIETNGPLPVELARNYLLQAAKGLQHAHSKGLIHRDIKPSNLVADDKERLTILDMGLARIDPDADEFDPNTQTNLELTRAGVVIGTIDYVAPEQARDARQADVRADIYSLGCTLHFLLTGEPIFSDGTAIDKLVAHRTAPIPSLHERRSDVPQSLDKIFQRMVAKSPDDRYQSMARLIAELRPRIGVLRHLLIVATTIIAFTVVGMNVWREFRPTTAISSAPNSESSGNLGSGGAARIVEPLVTGTRTSRSVSLSSDREFAVWVLEIGGSVEIAGARGVTMTIDSAVGLPNEPMTIRGVNLTGKSVSADRRWKHVRHLTELQHLFLNGSDVGDEQLALLKDLVKLRLLFLNNTKVSDSALRHLSGLIELRYLDLIGTRVTDSGLGQLKSLRRRLESLRLQETAVTEAGVKSLQKSLPNCRIAN